jgi:ribonucleoside-diphosphate reductase alpha chain
LRGLKTTYYLRTLGATNAEKSTVKTGQLNAVPSDGGMAGHAALSAASSVEPEVVGQACMLRPGDAGFDECEACQ